MRKHTNVVTLPKFLQACLPKPFNSLTVALAVALALDHHDGDGAAIRRTADKLRHRAKDHGPKLRRLAKELSDQEAIVYAIKMTHDVTRALGFEPHRPYEFIPDRVLADPPRCHYQPMYIAGGPYERHWQCRQCDATQPISFYKDVPHDPVYPSQHRA